MLTKWSTRLGGHPFISVDVMGTSSSGEWRELSVAEGTAALHSQHVTVYTFSIWQNGRSMWQKGEMLFGCSTAEAGAGKEPDRTS
jgi:hypothetical protein